MHFVCARLLPWRLLAAIALLGAVSYTRGASGDRAPVAASAVPADLRCEYRLDPIGIDSPNPRLSWKLAANDPAARGITQHAYQIIVASAESLLNAGTGDLWDSGRVGSDATNQISYAGKALSSNQRVYWTVKIWDQADCATNWAPASHWTMGALDADAWHGAKWLGAPDANVPGENAEPHNGPKAKYETVLLRRTFKVKPGLLRATANVCGLGQYEITLNGAKVGDIALTPGWTRYDKSCLYDTYDLTSSLQSGDNAVGLFLGNGFYNIHKGRYTKITCSFGPLKAICVIRLDYADASTEYVCTDSQWKTGSGPITFSSVYGGEDFDARLVQSGWDTPGFADSTWESPAITPGPGGALRGLSCAAPPVKTFESRSPISTTHLNAATTVYDLGQNASIMLRLKAHGPAGSVVKVTPSELVGPNGDIDDRMCGGKAFWTYTLRGGDAESYTSKFFYQGCRYLKVELSAGGGGLLPEVDSIEALVLHADAPEAGRFACSNSTFNTLYSLIHWAQQNNMMSVMTDCPHREKLGWLEEDHLNGPALRYNFGMATMMAKLCNDMADSQRSDGRDDGLVPSTCPDFPRWDGNGMYTNPPEWGSACIAVPWQQYQFDGDVELLRRHYPMMQRYVGYLKSRAKNGIVSFGLGDWYDNQNTGPSTLTPIGLTASAFYYYDTLTLGKIAALLGKQDEAAAAESDARAIRKQFNEAFYKANSKRYATGSQASNAFPLAMGIVDPANRADALANLVSDLNARGTTAGEVSLKYVLAALAQAGRSDVIEHVYGDDRSGYGLQVKLGKTALTEAWNGGTSQDHFMFGQINEWFFHDLAGIQEEPESHGFKKIVIRPAILGDMAKVSASYDSIQGRISSQWSINASGIKLNVAIPAGAEAIVYVPTDDAANIREGATLASASTGVRFVRVDSGAALYAVGSGNYAFASTIRPFPVNNLIAVVGNKSVKLTWTASLDADRYSVYRSTKPDSGFEALVSNTSETSFSDTAVTNDQSYYYRVCGIHSDGPGPATDIAATPSATAQSIVDGGFDEQRITGYVYSPTGTAWTFTPHDGINGCGIAADGSDFTHMNAPAPTRGQVAFIQGSGAISQTITGLTPGTSYTISFKAAQRNETNRHGQTWQIEVNGKAIGMFTPPKQATDYVSYVAQFTATSAKASLSFQGTNVRGGDNTIFIDDVRLSSQPKRAEPQS